MNTDLNKYLIILVVFLLMITLFGSKSNENFVSSNPANSANPANPANSENEIKPISDIKKSLLILKNRQILLDKSKNLENEYKQQQDKLSNARNNYNQSLVDIQKSVDRLEEIKKEIQIYKSSIKYADEEQIKHQNILDKKINNSLKFAKNSLIKAQSDILTKTQNNKTAQQIIKSASKLGNVAKDIANDIGTTLIKNLPVS